MESKLFKTGNLSELVLTFDPSYELRFFKFCESDETILIEETIKSGDGFGWEYEYTVERDMGKVIKLLNSLDSKPYEIDKEFIEEIEDLVSY